MPVATTTTVSCDRCRRVIPSRYLWPYTWGPLGPLQRTGLLCADLPNSCKSLVETVFFHAARVYGSAQDALDQ
jgi:hypothetical protein